VENKATNTPHPVFGFAENGMGWGLHVILNPWVSPMAIIVMPFQGIFEVSKYFNFGGCLYENLIWHPSGIYMWEINNIELRRYCGLT